MTAVGVATQRRAEPLTGPGESICHPLILGLLVLWAVNDHILKELFANGWTGKLSDVASLAVFPLIPMCVYQCVCALRGRAPLHADKLLLASLVATGAVMIGINISGPWASAYEIGLGAAQWPFRAMWDLLGGAEAPPLTTVVLTMDPSDLWTLPALWIPWRITRETRDAS